MTAVTLAGGALAALLALLLFLRMERAGRPEVALAIVVGALVVDGFLLPNQGVSRNSLFYIRVAGEDLRLPDVLLPLALLARLLVRGLPRRVTGLGFLWAAFLAWYATAAVVGLMRDNSTSQIIFHSKSLLYLGGGMALAAGVPAVRLIGARAAGWWALALAAAMALFVPMTLLDLSIPVDLGLVRAPAFGSLGPDGATVVLSLAVVLLVLECSRRRPRGRVALPLALVVVGTVATVQRATMLDLAVVVGALLVTAAGATWYRRMQVTATDGVLLVAALLAVLAAVLVIPIAQAEDSPVSAIYVDAFTSEANVGSAQARINIWTESWGLLRVHPLLGWGLGKQVFLIRPWPLEPEELAAHNILWDIAVRSGVVGLGLFGVAVAAAYRNGLRTWRRSVDPRVAALAAGSLIALSGVLAKGMVESVLEKYRVALVMGLLLGLLASAAADRRTRLLRVHREDPQLVDAPTEDRTTVG